MFCMSDDLRKAGRQTWRRAKERSLQRHTGAGWSCCIWEAGTASSRVRPNREDDFKTNRSTSIVMTMGVGVRPRYLGLPRIVAAETT